MTEGWRDARTRGARADGDGSYSSAGADGLHGIDEQVLDRASRGDAAWFRRHADRAHRIRPYLPGETPEADMPGGPGRLFTVVHLVRPGVRFRMFVRAQAQPGNSEHETRAIWERIVPLRFAQAALDLAAANLERGAR